MRDLIHILGFYLVKEILCYSQQHWILLEVFFFIYKGALSSRYCITFLMDQQCFWFGNSLIEPSKASATTGNHCGVQMLLLSTLEYSLLCKESFQHQQVLSSNQLVQSFELNQAHKQPFLCSSSQVPIREWRTLVLSINSSNMIFFWNQLLLTIIGQQHKEDTRFPLWHVPLKWLVMYTRKAPECFACNRCFFPQLQINQQK